MADEPDGTENFIIHETSDTPPAASEGSANAGKAKPTAEPEPEGEDAADNSDEGSEAAEDETEQDADDGDTDDSDSADDGDAADDDADGPRKGVPARKRIGQLTKARREAERRADAAEATNKALSARLEAIENKLTEGAGDDTDSAAGESDTAEVGKPDPQKFTYGEIDPEYLDAMLEWKLDKREATREAKQEKTRQTDAAQQQADKVQQDYDNKIEAGVEAYDDFEAVVIDGAGDQEKGIAAKYDLAPDFALMILESPVGHHIAYKVAKDPEYSRKLAKMSVQRQTMEFGRLEAQFTSKDASPKKKKKVTSAMPPPTSKVSGGSAQKKAFKDMSFAESEAHVRAEGLL